MWKVRASNSFKYMSIKFRVGGVGERNKYQARKSITKVSCRISSLRKVAEEVRGPCETSKKLWFLFTARLDAGAHVRLHLGYVRDCHFGCLDSK